MLRRSGPFRRALRDGDEQRPRTAPPDVPTSQRPPTASAVPPKTRFVPHHPPRRALTPTTHQGLQARKERPFYTRERRGSGAGGRGPCFEVRPTDHLSGRRCAPLFLSPAGRASLWRHPCHGPGFPAGFPLRFARGAALPRLPPGPSRGPRRTAALCPAGGLGQFSWGCFTWSLPFPSVVSPVATLSAAGSLPPSRPAAGRAGRHIVGGWRRGVCCRRSRFRRSWGALSGPPVQSAATRGPCSRQAGVFTVSPAGTPPAGSSAVRRSPVGLWPGLAPATPGQHRGSPARVGLWGKGCHANRDRQGRV